MSALNAGGADGTRMDMQGHNCEAADRDEWSGRKLDDPLRDELAHEHPVEQGRIDLQHVQAGEPRC